MSVARFLHHEIANARGIAHDLEHDPTRQWVWHRKMTWFWLTMFAPTIAMAAVAVAFSGSLLVADVLLIWNMLMSCYANFATEFDAVAAADAARKAPRS